MKKATLTATLLCVLSLAVPASAAAAPSFTLDIHHNQTNFAPGGAPVSPRLTTTTQGSAEANEVQRLWIPASAGSFTLSFEGETTTELSHNASPATIQAALRALPSIGSPNVVVGADFYATYITFTGALGDTDVPQLVAASAAPPNDLRRGPELWIDVANVGPTASSGQLTLTIELPSSQMSRNSVRFNSEPLFGQPNAIGWSCPGSAGQTTIVCTTSEPIPRHSISRGIIILLDISPTASGARFISAELEYQGQQAPPAAGCVVGIAACAGELVHISPDPAPFGILPESFVPDFTASDAITPVRAAGSRPTLFGVPFDFASVDSPYDSPPDQNPFQRRSSEPVRNLSVDLPSGFLGDPTAVAECSAAAFTLQLCPPASQVGRFDVRTSTAGSTVSLRTGFTLFSAGVYNLAHPFGKVSDLGMSVYANPIHIRASLDPARGYAISTEVPDINETAPAFDSKLTLWGVPADPTHDSERCRAFDQNELGGDTSEECPSDGPLQPFLTTPFQCGTNMSMRLHSYDSWEDSGDFGPPIASSLGSFTDCEEVPFAPTVAVAPTTDEADSPSGLDVTISVPQHEDCEPGPPVSCDIATSPLKDATVTLPEGLAVNPASANGLGACNEGQIALGTDKPVRCPDASRIAAVEVTTPLLPDPVEGVVYLATPHDNPFDSLLAGYIVLDEPARGILVKIPGRISVDEDTGKITGTFNENPQLPFSEFDLHFKGGAHSTLITPPTCGTYTSRAKFSPWSGTGAVAPTDSFEITDAPGSGCPGSESELSHNPGFDAGAVAPIAGHHSPFVVHLRREDGSQRFGSVTLTPPPGLTAKLAGKPYCPEAALAAAERRDGEDERDDPSCPAASRLGSVYAAAGAGSDPYWAPGTAYLTGPYKGAPLSMAILTPAVAGPFDLGTVVIRTALRVDPKTAQITAVSDEIPTTLEGIPLNVRRVAVALDRPQFTLNGTSCDPSAVSGTLLSTRGALAPLFNRFQLAECGRLAFKPRVALSIFGGVKRGAYQGLRAVVRPRPGDANIGRTVVRMPRSAFLAQEHIRTVCTRVQFAADACPKGAVYGKAIARSPLLDYPLEGDVYLRSSDNKLPDLVADLRGPAHQPIRVELVGRTDSVKGALRNTFDVVPDAPVSFFRLALFGGKKGLIVNSRNICAANYRAAVDLRAQNGRRALLRPALFNRKCKQLRRKGKKRAAGKRRARRASLSGTRLSD